LANYFFYLTAHSFQRDPEGLEGFRRHAFTFMYQAEQDMFGTDVVVVEESRFFLGKHNNSASSIRKPFKH
jgi:hypothetical protein